jgi:hypothetical protein
MSKTLWILILALMPLELARADWRTADRGSAGLAPAAADEPRAVVQVYAARTVRWRKYFAVHSWIAVKEKDAKAYRTYHVIGWRLRQGLPVVRIEEGIPDGKWFGHVPALVRDLRGPAAERAIPKIHKAAESYPYPNEYRAWPGPNSNTFISHILRATPELGVELPPHAIGKDWMDKGTFAGKSETGTGFQVSLFGVLGFTLGLADGAEVNLLGMTFGVDLWRPALKLPFLGRVGFSDAPVFEPSETESVATARDTSNESRDQNELLQITD